MPILRRAFGPGRVNLVGDHTDYNQGLALPMAIDLGVSVEFEASDRRTLTVASAAFEGSVELPLDPSPPVDAAALEPDWARLVAAMAALAPPAVGGYLRVDSTLPIGTGLASSAALTVALAEVFGPAGLPLASVVSRCQQAEHHCGVPVGAMDPLICAGGRRGHALLVDFATMATDPVPIPAEADIVVVESGQRRALRHAPYAARVEECRSAAAVIGPLGSAGEADLAAVRDPLLRRRCRHVVTECRRVRQMAASLRAGDLTGAGASMSESHRSLAADFEVSTPALDSLVDHLASRPGVLGARLTGAGFGGCVVALCRPGAVDVEELGAPGWHVVPVDGTVARRRPAAT